MGFVGVQKAFIIDSATFILSAFIIVTIYIIETHVKKEKEFDKSKYMKEFLSGISIMWKDKGLKLMLLIDLFVNFAMAMQGPLIYIFIKQTLQFGDKAEIAWGILLSSLGVGAIKLNIFFRLFIN